MLAVFIWWVVMQVFGLAALPLTTRVFAWLPDRGITFSKIVGLLLVSYLLWLGASSGLLINDAGGLLLALLVTAALSLGLARRAGALAQLRKIWREERRQILFAELIFLLAFAGWALVRAYAPDKILPAGGEKYMEIAFLNGVLNSPRFPPLDPWMAGYGISYYYFGYVMMAVMTRATAALPGVAFDLYDALLFALTMTGAYGVAANMVRAAGGRSGAAAAYGLLGGVFTAVMGNLQGLLEGLYSARLLPAAFWDWIDIPDLAGTAQNGRFFLDSGWWWWRASRVLRERDLFGEPTVFQPIDEFPFFSFLLGDNHPHKLGLPFVLLAVALAFNLLRRTASRSPNQRLDAEDGGLALFYALALGALAFLNTWDFPIYLGLVVLAWAAGRRYAGTRYAAILRAALERAAILRPDSPQPEGAGQDSVPVESFFGLLWRALLLAVSLGIGAVGLYFFFYLSFSSQAGGVLPHIFQPTRLPQWLVMWGPFAVLLAVFTARAAAPGRRSLGAALRATLIVAGISLSVYALLLLIAAAVVSTTPLGENEVLRGWLGGMEPFVGIGRILAARLTNPWLFLLLSALIGLAALGALRRLHGEKGEGEADLSTIFALLLAFTGLGLNLVVEFFYLRDNFGVRMNTIFKFYFQAWVMLACASAFAVWWLRQRLGAAARAAFTVVSAALLAGGLVYPVMAVASRADNFRGPASMDASASFSGFYPGHWAAQPDDWAAVVWLRENGREADGSAPTILEAGGGGYENAGRISAFTGFPTLLGWTNHEGQWRGSQAEITLRTPDIVTIYTTPSADLALELLRKWNVRYVIFGETERQYIIKQCQAAASPCDPNRARGKFRQALTPVFESGETIVYRVPALP